MVRPRARFDRQAQQCLTKDTDPGLTGACCAHSRQVLAVADRPHPPRARFALLQAR